MEQLSDAELMRIVMGGPENCAPTPETCDPQSSLGWSFSLKTPRYENIHWRLDIDQGLPD
jgi:hypothetical protein